MAKYRCTVCNYVFDEEKEGRKFADLQDTWRCPVCGAPKTAFILLSEGTTERKMGTTVSDVLIEQIAEWGIKYVFGIPGTSTLGVVEAIRKNPKTTYIQVRHEQTAAFMASAYGKLTGNIAACLGVSGPGATNLATGLYDASLDHSPVLALTGMVARQMIGPGSLQEIDQYSFFAPVCVFNKILMSEDQTTTLATLAVKHALLDRGVSHIGIPNDVQKLHLETKTLPLEGRIPNLAFSQNDELIAKAGTLIDEAHHPVIIAGFGSTGHGDDLIKLARKITAPIVTTFRAKGVVDEYDDIYVGSHGGIGSTAAAELVAKSDLLIIIGSSFSEMTNIPEKKTVQIDINPLMIAKTHQVDIALLGNSALLIPKLTNMVKERVDEAYLADIKKLKKQWLNLLEREADASGKPIRPPYIIKILNNLIADDAVISLDVGENCWWFGRNFWMKKTQKMVMSGYLGSMGFGLPGAMAAALAYPNRQIICITGDGGLTMVMGDFLTAVKNKLPIKVFVFNNKQLGMIMQEQKIENYPSWQTDLFDFNFANYAKNCGATGIRVAEPTKLEEAVKTALVTQGPAIVDIETDPKRFG